MNGRTKPFLESLVCDKKELDRSPKTDFRISVCLGGIKGEIKSVFDHERKQERINSLTRQRERS